MTGPAEPGDPAEPPAPAHTRGTPRPAPRERDVRSVVVRLVAVAAVAGVVVAAAAYDGAAGEPAAPPAAGAGGTVAAEAGAGMPAARPASAGSSTWYCVAGTGSSDGPADHRVLLANPTGAARQAVLTVVPGDVTHPPGVQGVELPGTATRVVLLPPGRRTEIRLGDELAAPLAAAVVEVDGGGVTVEHRVVGLHGADIGPCSPVVSDTWHLAWGTTTRDARDLVVLFNPFPSPATVDATFVSEDGPRAPVRWQGFPVPARSVVGVDVSDDVTRSHEVAATFRARTGRIAVERLGQFNGSLGVRGLSVDLAAPAATAWVFADGAATTPTPVAPEPGSPAPAEPRPGLATSEKIVVYNPGRRRAEVDVRLVPDEEAGGAAAEPFRLSVGPGAYDVVDYGGQSRVVSGARHGTVVRSTNGVPVVAERVVTDVYTPKPVPRSRSTAKSQAVATGPTGETSVTPGARLAATDWVFAALDADGITRAGALVVLNPDPDRPVRVQVFALAAGAAAGGKPLAQADVPAGRVAALPVPGGPRAGAVVVRAAAPVVVERLLRAGDGRRQALGPGIPSLAGARPVDELVAGAGGRDDR